MRAHHQSLAQESQSGAVGLRVMDADRTLRAGDEDRRRVAELLQSHYVDGRLTQAEFEGRVQAAVEAKTRGDLDALLTDLPDVAPSAIGADGQRQRPAQEERVGTVDGCGEQSFRRHVTSYFLVIGMLVAIWALTTPGGYFWPVWPMLGWGIGLAWHGLQARTKPQHRDGHDGGHRSAYGGL